MINSNTLSMLTDTCNIQCPVCYLQHKNGSKATRHSVLVSKSLCPVLLVELLSCLHCLETNFDRRKPQLYTELLLLSWEFFSSTNSASFKKTKFIYRESKPSVQFTKVGLVKFPSIRCLSTLQVINQSLERLTALPGLHLQDL